MNDASKFALHTEAKEVVSKLQTRAFRLIGHYARVNGKLHLIQGIEINDSGICASLEGLDGKHYADSWTFVDCDAADVELGAK